MATYVMSDLHGQYEAYIKMLGKIMFSADDFICRMESDPYF